MLFSYVFVVLSITTASSPALGPAVIMLFIIVLFDVLTFNAKFSLLAITLFLSVIFPCVTCTNPVILLFSIIEFYC